MNTVPELPSDNNGDIIWDPELASERLGNGLLPASVLNQGMDGNPNTSQLPVVHVSPSRLYLNGRHLYLLTQQATIINRLALVNELGPVTMEGLLEIAPWPDKVCPARVLGQLAGRTRRMAGYKMIVPDDNGTARTYRLAGVRFEDCEHVPASYTEQYRGLVPYALGRVVARRSLVAETAEKERTERVIWRPPPPTPRKPVYSMEARRTPVSLGRNDGRSIDTTDGVPDSVRRSITSAGSTGSSRPLRSEHLQAISSRSSEDDWRHRALCKDEDPEFHFPVGTSGPALLAIAKAKAVCRHCPVTSECLTWALETGQDAGVWGGMSEDERRALKRRTDRTAEHTA